ncbi:13095_t:CDS:2 [Dentiscutata heterogama]|uniref:13095_t:CDS:1 n=1 Tax=Dentiscutata heterogama TaxID=1316150 RepID=A0ACA9KJG4_9GLOM|nr:13095_t:CDS:2 [Dentiscutata heterogama]
MNIKNQDILPETSEEQLACLASNRESKQKSQKRKPENEQIQQNNSNEQACNLNVMNIVTKQTNNNQDTLDQCQSNTNILNKLDQNTLDQGQSNADLLNKLDQDTLN